MRQGFGHKCPHCGFKLRIRDSEGVHDLFRRTLLECTNTVDCGATFSGHSEITYALVPSANPRPNINLPFAPRSLAKQLKRNLQTEQSKNQNDLFDEEEESDTATAHGE